MSRNKIEGQHAILRAAPRGSKAGWITVSTELSPERHQEFLMLVHRRKANRSDVAREAIERLIESERRSGQDRRKAS